MTTTETPSITAALAQANRQFGGVHKFLPQPNGWGYTSWSEHHRAWRAPQIGQDYNQAMTSRAWAVAGAAARIILASQGADEETLFDIEAWAEQLSEDSIGLSPHDRVRQLLDRVNR